MKKYIISKDMKQSNAHYKRCQIANIPYVVIRKGRKYCTVSLDLICTTKRTITNDEREKFHALWIKYINIMKDIDRAKGKGRAHLHKNHQWMFGCGCYTFMSGISNELSVSLATEMCDIIKMSDDYAEFRLLRTMGAK